MEPAAEHETVRLDRQAESAAEMTGSSAGAGSVKGVGNGMSERLVSWALWTVDRYPFGRSIGGGHLAATRGIGRDEAFVWRHGRADVALEWDGDAWKVTYGAIGRLLGPRQTLHEMRHRRADLAAWDVMARVIHASRDEDLGIQVACEAARWMKDQGHPDFMDA